MIEPSTETSEDTVSLLLDEIARLEAELRARDETDRFEPPAEPIACHGPADDELARQIELLTNELAGRDETIVVLLEQSELFEQAAAAQRAEWEQLHQWVQDVEQRVDSKDSREAQLESELQAERRRYEAQAQSIDVERKTAESRRQLLEREIQELRGRLSNRSSDLPGDQLADELERENRSLREFCARYEAAAGAVGPLRQRLESTLVELDEVRTQLKQVEDDRQRERNEAEAELSAMRTRLASESSQRKAEEEQPAVDQRQSSAIEADERIRAFREHLRELHKNEAEERAGRSLASRLSRLWRSTGPG
jgi:chromosome segregation ATPase